MRLILIRHAESVGNAERRFQGQADFPLSPRGERQTELLAARLEADPPDVLYSSPLLRTHRTAEVIAAATGLSIRPLPEVMEYHFGEVSGLTWAEIRERYPEPAAVQVAAGSPDFPLWPGEEGREPFRERVCSALWGLEAAHTGETVAVVTHGGPVMVFCLAVLGLPYRRPLPFRCDNASITRVEVKGGAGVLLTVNDICHLRDEAPVEEE